MRLKGSPAALPPYANYTRPADCPPLIHKTCTFSLPTATPYSPFLQTMLRARKTPLSVPNRAYYTTKPISRAHLANDTDDLARFRGRHVFSAWPPIAPPSDVTDDAFRSEMEVWGKLRFAVADSTKRLVPVSLENINVPACIFFLLQLLAHENFPRVRTTYRLRHKTICTDRKTVLRHSTQGRKRLRHLNFSLIRYEHKYHTNLITPETQFPLPHSHSHNNLHHNAQPPPTRTSSSRASAPSLGKRAPAANNDNFSNKKRPPPPPPRQSSPIDPPPPPIRSLHGPTLNIRSITPNKWEFIQKIPVFKLLDYIILTEHQLSAQFRPDEIIKSGWDFHAISGPETNLPQKSYRAQRHTDCQHAHAREILESI